MTLISDNWLFVETVVGFLCSAGLVLSVTIPQPEPSGRKGSIYDNTTRGISMYLATPRQRGLLALSLSVAAAGAMVMVNTVVLVKGLLGGTDSDVALACFGGESMIAELLLPRVLVRMANRAVMLPSPAVFAAQSALPHALCLLTYWAAGSARRSESCRPCLSCRDLVRRRPARARALADGRSRRCFAWTCGTPA